MKIVFAGGGTGGHIYPALAIAGKLKEKVQDLEIVYMAGSKSMEKNIVEKAGYRVETLPVVAMPRKISPALVAFAWKLGVSVMKSISVLREAKPAALVATGGYVAGPPIMAARILGIPIVIQEQNSYPGVTNRKLGRFADIVFLGFGEAEKYFPSSVETVESGNPIRDGFGTAVREESSKSFGLDPAKKTLIVFGGSQGARAINNTMAEIAGDITSAGCQLIWQTGKFEYDRYSKFDNADKGIRVLPFIENMSAAYAAADLVVSRSGAMAIAEISACGLPALFIPLPTAAANHQEYNARSLVDRGAASLILERDLTSEKLLTEIKSLFNDEGLLRSRSESAKQCARTDAAETIADSIVRRFFVENRNN